MTRAIAGGLLVLLVTGSPAWAVLLDVGTHYLEPNAAAEVIELYVTTGSGETAGGANINLQIANGGPEVEGYPGCPGAGAGIDGPTIANVDVVTGTVFSGAAYGIDFEPNPINDVAPQLYQVGVWTNDSNYNDNPAILDAPEMPMTGLLATVTLDANEFSAGSWDFIAGQTLEGPTQLIQSVGGDTLPTVPLTVVDGTVAIASTLTSVANANWNVATTWDDPPTVPFEGTKTVVNHAVDVQAAGTAFSLNVDAGGELTVEPGVEVHTDRYAVVGGTGTLGFELSGNTGVLANAVSGTLDADGDVTLQTNSTLALTATDYLGDPAAAAGRGFRFFDLIGTDGVVSGTFTNLPDAHLGNGVFLSAVCYDNPVNVEVLRAGTGDVDGDAQVDFNDVWALLTGGRYNQGAPAVWTEGDVNDTNDVDFNDVWALLTSGLYNQGPYDAPAGCAKGGSFAVVPEPGSIAMLLGGGLALLLAVWRRRRKA